MNWPSLHGDGDDDGASPRRSDDIRASASAASLSASSVSSRRRVNFSIACSTTIATIAITVPMPKPTSAGTAGGRSGATAGSTRSRPAKAGINSPIFTFRTTLRFLALFGSIHALSFLISPVKCRAKESFSGEDGITANAAPRRSTRIRSRPSKVARGEYHETRLTRVSAIAPIPAVSSSDMSSPYL